ncbi:MAG: signal peptidase II [Myxococcota bacterium]
MTRDSQPPTVHRSLRAIILCLVAVVGLTALDLGSKGWALDALSSERPGGPPPVCEPTELGHILYQRQRGDAVVLVPGYLELRYAENCGAAFGLMREAEGWVRRTVFGLAAAVASVTLLWMFVRGRGGPMFAWSVPFIVSGAIGNLVDRARLGYVVDFVRFHLQDTWEWPTFNVADAAITVGVVLLLLDGLREGRREKAEAKPAPEIDAGDAPRS